MARKVLTSLWEKRKKNWAKKDFGVKAVSNFITSIGKGLAIRSFVNDG